VATRVARRELPLSGHAKLVFCDQSIERTFSWLSQNQRMSKHYENLCSTRESFVYAAMVRLMVVRRLTCS